MNFISKSDDARRSCEKENANGNKKGGCVGDGSETRDEVRPARANKHEHEHARDGNKTAAPKQEAPRVDEAPCKTRQERGGAEGMLGLPRA